MLSKFKSWQVLKDDFSILCQVASQQACCGSKTSKRQRRLLAHKSFLFGGPSSIEVDNWTGRQLAASLVQAGIIGAAATLLTPASMASAVACSCVTLIVPIGQTICESGLPISSASKACVTNLLACSGINGSLSLFEFLMGDLSGGLVNMAASALGVYVTTVDGVFMLPSYSSVSLIMGAVSLIRALHFIILPGVWMSPVLPLTVNLKLGITVAHPFLFFAASYLSLYLVGEIRNALLPPVPRGLGAQNGESSLTAMRPTLLPFRPFAGVPRTVGARPAPVLDIGASKEEVEEVTE